MRKGLARFVRDISSHSPNDQNMRTLSCLRVCLCAYDVISDKIQDKASSSRRLLTLFHVIRVTIDRNQPKSGRGTKEKQKRAIVPTEMVRNKNN